ncbi:mandelate racemase/muconate lactonizing enzyme family protein [Bacilliculturomica massiliensis]|uniref:mandelate racemase/muconate lactonizing enzyme family protein n=1 Tax=Bacilliculturomica massiliensis TaxID=1917867 RepID=UPI0010326F28|nr:enolase C-terminal domain-like protein [Bacilliculturomica massiliensis]
MRITKIKVTRLKIPLKKPYVLSKEYGVLKDTQPVIVTVYTDHGTEGYGECDPWPLFTGDSAPISYLALCAHIGPALIGADPCNISEIHQIMDRTIRNMQLTKSAVDMACYDILGKHCDVPVHCLLGGKRRDEIPVMWSVGGGSPEEMAQEVLKVKEEGYQGCMIKVGGADHKLDARRVIQVRQAVGPDFPLVADANQGWDVNTAIRFARQVEECGLMFFEQPVQSWDTEGLARVRRSVPMPVSADEGVATIQDAVRLVKEKAADIFSIKVTKHGGIGPAREICSYARANGIQLFFNSMIEEGITQAASLALGAWAEDLVPMGHAYFSPLRLERDISTFSSQIHSGFIQVNGLPGLGVELDGEAIERYSEESYTVE